MDFSARLAAYRARTEAALGHWVPPAGTRPARLHAALRYSLEAGGKRLRPVLLLAAADLRPGGVDAAPAAAAIECLHTYTLIHDDLPCMDDSDLRRGRPSCHRQFDEATAVLAGDALLTLAFKILAEAYAPHPELVAPLVFELARAADSERLIGGQMEDIENEGRRLTPDQLDYLHQNKTAALLSAALAMGAILARAPAAEVERLRAAGRATGLAFQIVDDLLDATATSAELGKTAGADAAGGKNTYVLLHGLEASRRRAAALTDEAVGLLAGAAGDTAFLRALVAEMAARTR